MNDNKEIMNPEAFFKLSYGIFVITARENGKDNGCIINTAQLLTDTPKRITVSINKSNYTHDMIIRTGVFTVSVLTESTPFDMIKQFGFSSGREFDKFEDFGDVKRAENGLYYTTAHTNSYISAKVVAALDYDTHTLFVADVTEAAVISDERSATYAYYHEKIKPQRPAEEKKNKGYVCKICGYLYEGDELPADFVCPLCKHGAEDFEPVK